MKSNNTHINILASFAYMANSSSFVAELINASKQGDANVMIDSGAFSIFNIPRLQKLINLKTYCSFLQQVGEHVEKYVTLDVINDEKQSRSNYEAMLKQGLNPMYVLTNYDDDFEYLKYAVANNPHICVAGGVASKGNWIIKRFQDVNRQTNAKIHALGYVKYPNMLRVGLESVDSSTWIQAGGKYGTLTTFNASKGLQKIGWTDILRKRKPMPSQLGAFLDRHKITPKHFSNVEYHKGHKSIAVFSNIVSYIEMQKYSQKQGTKLFLAIGNAKQLKQIMWVNDQLEYGKLDYDSFVKHYQS